MRAALVSLKRHQVDASHQHPISMLHRLINLFSAQKSEFSLPGHVPKEVRSAWKSQIRAGCLSVVGRDRVGGLLVER